jgi:two-component system C4-dicarboxylate transport sensor histidine kinase DctB
MHGRFLPFPRAGFIGAAALIGALLLVGVYLRARSEALAEAMAVGHQRLGLYTATIRGAVDRLAYLPGVIARDRQMVELLKEVRPDRVDAANRKLEAINDLAQSASLYIMNGRGVTVAASNWNTDISYVGRDYSFRPYFHRAMAGGTGRLFGIGVTTLLPGYFLAAPVKDNDGTVLGAVVVKIDLEPLEQDWGRSSDAVMVTDEDGVVILTSRPDWKYAVDGAISDELRHRLSVTQRYGDIPIRPLGRQTLGALQGGASLERSGGATYVGQSQRLEEEGWTVHFLADWDTLERRVLATTLLAGVGWVAFVLLLMVVRQRRQVLKAKLAARDQLERMVAQRTEALSAEINHHQRTERHLRETQDELIHAGRMAALGQMSAAIAHELNQPLAAIRTFVASSKLLVERGELAAVAGNLGMIGDLGTRMADIIRHLRVFARKSPTQTQPLDPAASIARALILLEPRLRDAGIELVGPLGSGGAKVAGDAGRLDQVFVNLFANAIDALSDQPARRIVTRIESDGAQVMIQVRDSGPGLAPEVMDKVFEPFFTTKEVGEGLGLGLSLSYGIVRDMGGAIRVENAEGGGAVFTLTFPALAGDAP